LKDHKRGKWSDRWEIERLSQLRADVDSTTGRLATEYVRRSTQATNEESAEWLRRCEQVEAMRSQALGDIDRWITERCKGTDDTPGC
jgi:hypothetical protein